jgi:peptidyl-dipeptidase Dcp
MRRRQFFSYPLLPLLVLLLVPRVASPQGAPTAARQAVQAAAGAQTNPLLGTWTTPFQVPPFAEIKPEHFLPAFKAAIADERKEIDAIANNPQPPTFANTIEAQERSGRLLSRVSGVFSNLSSADTNRELQAINRETAPLLSALRDDIRLNEKLFARVKAVYDQRAKPGLTPPQAKLLEDSYKSFVRSGANLDAAKKERLRAINTELSSLSVRFSDALLHDTNAYELVIDKKEDLAGLPDSIIAGAADAARTAKMPGKWLFTLQAPSIWPFLQYADNRELRRQILNAYTTRCEHGDEYDTRAVAARIAALRAERANVLGYKTHADYVLEENMAKTPAAVYGLLNQLWTPARRVALTEAAALQDEIKKTGQPFKLDAWDWRYYAEKVKKARYDVDDQVLRPYFELDNVVQGAFYVANRLYGITFTPRPDLPVYDPEVKAYEVKDRDGSHLGVFYTDYFPRPGKRVGAWTSAFRGSWVEDGQAVRPIVVNVCNFSRPTGDEPALLNLEETSTLFHEFGHALHSLLSRVPYASLRGVPRDFVELPSQIMENWATEPDVLRVYAKHYKTGEVIPLALVDKMKKAEQFNQGFATVEYLAASFLDMDWHTLPAGPEQDTSSFEKQSMAKIQLPPEIPPRYRTTYYNHIWASGYSAGYYSYIWSEVLDADAFQAFKEHGLFDQATAARFRTLLEKGGMEEGMALYKVFRGKEPSVEPLLIRRGLKAAGTKTD